MLDRQAPRVSVAVKRSYRVAEAQDALVVRIVCSEACAAKADLVVARTTARRIKLGCSTVVGTGAARFEAAAATYAFVRFDRRARLRIFKQRRTPMTLRFTVADPRNVRRETERVTLRR